MAEELLEESKGGWALGNRDYRSPLLMEELREEGLDLLAPYKPRTKVKKPSWPRSLTQKRRRVETVIGQLVER